MTALKPIIEALLFGSEAPLSLKEICHIIEEVNDPSDGQQMLWQAADISRTLSEMVAEYATGPQGFYLAQVAGAYQFRTKPAYAPFLRSLCKEKPYRISRSAMEVLSIVAYRQPVTRAEIDEVRGVDSSAGLRTLLERGLVRSLGHSEHVGHPSLFGTTPLFLEVFNLNALEELPPMATPALVAPGASGSSTPAGSLAAEPAGATDADAAALAVLESTPSMPPHSRRSLPTSSPVLPRKWKPISSWCRNSTPKSSAWAMCRSGCWPWPSPKRRYPKRYRRLLTVLRTRLPAMLPVSRTSRPPRHDRPPSETHLSSGLVFTAGG